MINFPSLYSLPFHVDFFFFSLIALNNLFPYFLHLPLAIFSTAWPHLYVKLCLNWFQAVLFFSIDHIFCWISKSHFYFYLLLLILKRRRQRSKDSRYYSIKIFTSVISSHLKLETTPVQNEDICSFVNLSA